MSIIEAVDILSCISEIHESTPVFSEEIPSDDALHPGRWVDGDRIYENEELLKEVFDAVFRYFEQTEQKQGGALSDAEKRKGPEAVAAVFREAADKIVRYTKLFTKGPDVHHLFELHEYSRPAAWIEKKIDPLPKSRKKRKHLIESEEKREADFEIVEDLERFKEDLDYELFYLQEEGGDPLYDPECIRRLSLLYRFEKPGEETDPIVIKIKMLEAKDFRKRAVSTLVGVHSLAKDFYKMALKMKDNEWASALTKALMSLMLAATPRSLSVSDSLQKTSSDYFSDFREYVREALESKEYVRYDPKGDPNLIDEKMFTLTTRLCSSYFLSVSLEKEIATFLKELTGISGKILSDPGFLESEDRALRDVLKNIRGGPVKKLISSFIRGDFEQGWDPLLQQRTASKIFSCTVSGAGLEVLHMPAPVKQTTISKAKPAEEFEIFLEECIESSGKKMVIVDCRDSTSEPGHACAEALAGLLEHRRESLSILRLAKKTDFYFQKNEYADLSDAARFLKTLTKEVSMRGAAGFAFPRSYAKDEPEQLTTTCASLIHEVFFFGKKELSVEERQDFIEILYAFFILKTVEKEKPSHLAFTSKDGLDEAVSPAAEFFFLMKSLFFDGALNFAERDFLFWLLYGPVLTARERVTSEKEIERVIRFIRRVEEGIAKNGAGFRKKLAVFIRTRLVTDIEISSG